MRVCQSRTVSTGARALLSLVMTRVGAWMRGSSAVISMVPTYRKIPSITCGEVFPIS